MSSSLLTPTATPTSSKPRKSSKFPRKLESPRRFLPSKTTQNSPAGAKFLTIPAEIRQIIYEYVFPKGQTFTTFAHVPPPGKRRVYFSNEKTFFRYRFRASPEAFLMYCPRDDSNDDCDHDMYAENDVDIGFTKRYKKAIAVTRDKASSSGLEFSLWRFDWKEEIWKTEPLKHGDWRTLDHKWISRGYEKGRKDGVFDYEDIIRPNSLLYTCRLIRKEATPVYYQHNRFCAVSPQIRGLGYYYTMREWFLSRSKLTKKCLRDNVSVQEWAVTLPDG